MAFNVVVKVHPVVLFQIVDSYERRNADSLRVIGTLLGTVEKGVVEVSNCFCVPHREHDNEVEAELVYAAELRDLNARVNTQETVVGWWATGNEVTRHSSLIHDYYTIECPNAIHLTLDTTLQGTSMGIKAYIRVPIGTPSGNNGSMFTTVPVEITCYEPERVGLQLSSKTIGIKKSVEPVHELAQVSEATGNVLSMLDTVLDYVNEILAGRNISPQDNAVGRALLDMVNSVPKMTPEEFENMLNSNIKDLLMVICLSQLTKTQIQLNEKLTLLTTL
ncbi:Hypothetical predicted protein [Cloeon dipterum]|uniref:Eukaryotic translation initiation factor 3 subunit F n=1 Tax=Cloeon dipterum TaxID=197152 RepID=A0A8S1CT16_9INSE|nr:Hypothetical predicted protein [Cloeon dipterum]